MRPISTLDRDEALALRGLLFDLDDTLLDHGRLGEAAYSALFRLREAGLELYVVTGRPFGWVRLLGKLFPVNGAVGENGGVLLGPGGEALETLPHAERSLRAARLVELVRAIREQFPELEPPDDVSERVTDYTFDIGEKRRVAREVVQDVGVFARERGATVHVSSVHLHVGFDAVDKASGVVSLLRRLTKIDATAALHRYAFIGDSENDAACFAAFRTTVGVANLSGRPSLRPRFITEKPRGDGFAELAAVLGALRS
jgi:HAD superfamily hydrolase (TIGR01484 family)